MVIVKPTIDEELINAIEGKQIVGEKINIKKATAELAKEADVEEEQVDNKYVKYGKFGPYVLIEDLVDDLLLEFHIRTIYGKRGEDVWVYNEDSGLWELNGKEIIKSRTEELVGSYSKIKVVNEVFEKIKRKTSISREEFEVHKENLICLSNGVLDTKTMELKPFSPEYYFKTKLNIVYDKSLDCPNIKDFLNQTFYQEDIPVIQEWIGFHLYKRHFIKKALILFGPKNTGKTIFLNLLVKFIGERNKTGISLHSISKGDKFTLSFLKDKYANIYDDLSFNDLKDAGGFKIATGGGYVTAEYKFGDTFEFLNYAKNTFATNKIPVIEGESDDAYFLRWLPIPCDNEVSQEEQNPFLLDKMTSSNELSGFLNFGLEGLQRLFKNGKFSYNKTIEETRILMEKHSNHLAAFTQDCLRENRLSRITKEEMYEMYTFYAKENNLQRLTKTQLGRSLPKFAKFVSAKRETERYWDNVSINPDNKTLKTHLEKALSNSLIDNISLRGIDMVFEKVSNLSKQDTLDTSNIKDNQDINMEEKI